MLLQRSLLARQAWPRCTCKPIASQSRHVTTRASNQDFLLGVSPENRDEVAEVIDKAERALSSWALVATNFLTPPVAADAMRALELVADVTAVSWGGFSSSERCRILLGRDEVMTEVVDNPASSSQVCAVQTKGNFMFDAATHPDFLGACLGAGIDRRTVGDILVQGDRGAQIICTPEMADFLEMALVQVRSVKVETQTIPLSELKVPPPRTQEISTVEASMRLDSIASAGFRTSRSKMIDLIKGGNVRVNWKELKKGSVDVKTSDVISCTGKGRIKVGDVVKTSKGKFRVELTRFV